jgi:DNA-binding transcriptional ArsR family regulator
VVTQQTDVFHAVADVTRRAILDQLHSGAKPVNESARMFPISRPAISKHLRVLHEASLVTEHREGRENFYRLNPAPLRKMDRWLERYRSFWSMNLIAFEQTTSGTLVRIGHSGFGDHVKSRQGHSEGWKRVLGWLQQYTQLKEIHS